MPIPKQALEAFVEDQAVQGILQMDTQRMKRTDEFQATITMLGEFNCRVVSGIRNTRDVQ
jgi:hypothetical protein